MADRQQSSEPEEQIDLEGDNDVEEDDMMDDEDPVEEEDNAYRKGRGEFGEEDEDERSYGADDDNDEDGSGDGGRRHEKVANMEGVNDDAPEAVEAGGREEEVEEERKVEPKDDEDRKKWAELLALPPHGSEVFIGGLPRDASEEDLRELAETFGEIFEVRIMKDKDTKESKGFAFVMFTNGDAAQKAIEGIHEKEFKGRKLRCSLSQAKYRLFVGNVPKSLSEDELKKILEDCGPGVEHVEMFRDPHNPARNRGFLFVEYYNHACAEYSRQKMMNPNFKMHGTNPTVSWADPKNSADSSAASQVKAVYVKNLPENVTSERLKEIFECNGDITKVVLPPAKAGQGKRDFGFIHFAERSSALKAVKATEKYEIDGHALEVSLAKPQADKKVDHGAKPGLIANFPTYPPYGYPTGDPYGSYGGGGYGATGLGQPMIYGRGPMPAGMRMVPMVLPDGRLGYVLQQPGPQPSPPPHRRGDHRSGGSSEGGGGSRGGSRSDRRYHPY